MKYVICLSLYFLSLFVLSGCSLSSSKHEEVESKASLFNVAGIASIDLDELDEAKEDEDSLNISSTKSINKSDSIKSENENKDETVDFKVSKVDNSLSSSKKESATVPSISQTEQNNSVKKEETTVQSPSVEEKAETNTSTENEPVVPVYVLPQNYTDNTGMHYEYYWTETEAQNRFLALWDQRKECRWHSLYFDDYETEYFELMWED